MSYNLGYTSLPTFNSNSIGYVNPGSITDVSSISLNVDNITNLATFTNVPIGVYLFVSTGYYQSYSTATNQYLYTVFYNLTNPNAMASNYTFPGIIPGGVYYGGTSMSYVLVNSTVQSYTFRTNVSDGPAYWSGSAQLVRIA